MFKKFPEKFVERIQRILPENEWADFFEKCTEPMPKVVRMASPLLGGIEGDNEKLPPLTPGDWELKSTAISEAFFIERADQNQLPLGKTLEHFTGEIYVQSLSSMLPVQILDPQPEKKLLDMCAAPGSKTTFLAQRMKNSGLIVANEPSSSRSKKLAANLDRLGVLNSVMVQSDGTKLDQYYGQEFDKILLDAPCSSEGFGRKDSKFFEKMWAERKIFEAAKLQKKLIISAFNILVPEGEMVYSTCTSAPEENEAVVQHLLDVFGDAVEILPINLNIPHRNGLTEWEGQKFSEKISEKCVRLYPHLRSETWNSESFFVCKIRKKSALKIEPPQKPIQKNPLKVLKKNHQAEVVVRLAKIFGMEKSWVGTSILAEKDGDIYLTTPQAAYFCKKNLYRRAGLKIWDKDGNLTTEFALKFGNLATQNFVELDEELKNRWLSGYDLPNQQSNFEDPRILVKYQDFCLGWGKVVNGKIKNKLDRDLVF